MRVKAKKGFALAECIIAIALVGIIAASALGVVAYTSRAREVYNRGFMSLDKLRALYVCHRSGDFKTAGELLTGLEINENDDGVFMFYFDKSGKNALPESFDFKITVSGGQDFFGVIYDSRGKVIYQTPKFGEIGGSNDG